ncbi:tetratricopeptide repeat protein [Desulfonatronum thiodismutans]|uniref:tetratricopeptide repeat protein n=1 Tax=Desulfonatronum thiodismutans TaxID=159290 RepID=UPI00068D5F4F|nr:tetratricopeptide repeat protein [Desulfonatronum thiodismutans]
MFGKVFGFFLGLVVLVCGSEPVSALEMSLRQYPQREQVALRLSADTAGTPVVPQVRRVEGQAVRLELPGVDRSELADLDLPSPAGSLLLTAFLREPTGLVVRTSTEAFGFVSQFNPSTGLLLVDFFPDPLGNRWQETASRQASPPAAPAPEPSDIPATSPPESPPAAPPPPPSQARASSEPTGTPDQRIVPRMEPSSESMTAEVRRPLRERPEDQAGDPVSMPASMPTATEDVPQVRAPIRSAVPEQVESSAPLASAPDTDASRIQTQAQTQDQTQGQSAIRSPISRVGPDQAAPVAPVIDQPVERQVAPPVEAAAEPLPALPEAMARPEPIAQPDDPSMSRAPILRQPVPEAESADEELIEPAPVTEIEPSEPLPAVVAEESDAVPDPPESLLESEATPAPSPSPSSPTIPEQAEDPDQQHQRLLTSARAAMMNSEFDAAIAALRALSNLPDLSDTAREEVLYNLGDALFGLHQADLADNFGPIAQAYERAMNFNPKSQRTATALRNLGVLHLRVNNLPEAKAYFNVLKRDYPHDPLVPTTEYYLGQFFLERGDYDQAADYFQIVVQNHPEHSIAQQSSVGLAKALNALGYDEQAFQIMDFMEKRWPRYYIDEPELLELAGIIALRVNALESAKQRLLTYYNLIPDTPEADMLLARIGDIYLLSGQPDPARRVFERAAELFPDQEGGLIAKMRLVEGGIHDEPSLDDMFAMRRAAEVYSEIISKHPDSPLAAVATVKLAIWQIWNKRLEDSLMVISGFLGSRPNHSLVPKALEVGVEAFTRLVERNAADGRYPEILEQWQANVFLHDMLDELSPSTQLGLAMAYWSAGDMEQAIALARPYLGEDTPKELQISALELILGIFLEQQEWARIVDLAPLRDDLPGPQRRELTYSVALAMENLGRSEEARPLWRGLAEDFDLTDAQRGYALYFLARTAMQEENFERVYLYAQEALSLLLLDREDTGKIRDAVTWLTQVTERTGRLQEALAWALELDQLIDRSDPDWSMSRYRLAQLYQRAQNHAEWKAVLEDLKTEDPQGLYGRLAASALQGRTLEDSAGRFF